MSERGDLGNDDTLMTLHLHVPTALPTGRRTTRALILTSYLQRARLTHAWPVVLPVVALLHLWHANGMHACIAGYRRRRASCTIAKSDSEALILICTRAAVAAARAARARHHRSII